MEPQHLRAVNVPSSAVVSGDSESEADDEFVAFQRGLEAPPGRDDGPDDETVRFNRSNHGNNDDFYDNNLDEEDEAFVYKNLRGGVHETVPVRPDNPPSSLNPEEDITTLQSQNLPMQVYKPRNSDAVLSCPSCFNIVCMDCQRHQKYLNQFRAMFVMGIRVDWETRLVYNEEEEALIPKPRKDEGVEPDFVDSHHPSLTYKPGEYFAVVCLNCDTRVASLDMTEEVYHFFGCLESG